MTGRIVVHYRLARPLMRLLMSICLLSIVSMHSQAEELRPRRRKPVASGCLDSLSFLGRAAASVAAFVRKHERLPSWQELAQAQKLSEAKLTAEFKKEFGPSPDLMRATVKLLQVHHTESLEEYRQIVRRSAAAHLSHNLVNATHDDIAVALGARRTYVREVFPDETVFRTEVAALARTYPPAKAVLAELSKEISEAATQFARSTREWPPTDEELAELVDKPLTNLFGETGVLGDRAAFFEKIRLRNPRLFAIVRHRSLYTQERRDALMDAVRTAQDLLVTAVKPEATLSKWVLRAVDTWKRAMSGEAILYPAYGAVGSVTEWHFKLGFHVMPETLALSPRTILHGIELNPQLDDPLSGLDHLVRPGQTVVVFHPRRRGRMVAIRENVDNPTLLITSGDMSEPEYGSETKTGQRQNRRSEARDEFVGKSALILSLVPPPQGQAWTGATGEYTPRRITFVPADEAAGLPAGFWDLGRFYGENGVVYDSPPIAQSDGDAHLPNVDPEVIAAVRDQILPLGARAIVSHDGTDGVPFNGHEKDDAVSRTKNAISGENVAEQHVSWWVEDINARLLATRPRDGSKGAVLVEPWANHSGIWTTRAIRGGKLIEDGSNALTAAEVFAVILRSGRNAYHEILYRIGVSEPDRVHLLRPEENYLVGTPPPGCAFGPCNVGQHGDVGISGAKSLAIKAQAIGHGNSIVGHYHRFEEWDFALRVGTMTPRRMPYGLGGLGLTEASSAAVSPQGVPQAYLYRNGYFFRPLDYNQVIPRAQGFPMFVPRRLPQYGTTPDAYTDFRDRVLGRRR